MSIEDLIKIILVPSMTWLIYKVINLENWRSGINEKNANEEKRSEEQNLNIKQLEQIVIRLDKVIAIHEEKHKIYEEKHKFYEEEMKELKNQLKDGKNGNNN